MSIKVMVADDAAFMRMLLKGILENGGYEVVCEAHNGVDAIEKFKLFHPQVVTMDITMPDMDGIHAVKEIVAIDPKAIVIMVSAMGQQAMMVDALKAGAKDFIVKPFDKSNILDMLEKHTQSECK